MADQNKHYQDCIEAMRVKIKRIQLDMKELQLSESTRLLLMGEITGLNKAIELLEQVRKES